MTAVAQDLDALIRAHSSDAGRLPAAATSRFTRDEIVLAIRRWTDQYGEPPKVFDWDPSWARRRGEEWRADRFEAGNWPSIAIVRRQFGNLSKALFAAGVRPRRGPARIGSHRLTDDEILDAIRVWTQRYGELPAIADWSPARAREMGQLWRVDRYYAGNWPSYNTVVRRFGTLTEAARRAGLEPRPRGHRTSTGPSLDRDARDAIERQLKAPGTNCGPAVVATRVRSVADARNADDLPALRGALIDLAAAALSWADGLDAVLGRSTGDEAPRIQSAAA